MIAPPLTTDNPNVLGSGAQIGVIGSTGTVVTPSDNEPVSSIRSSSSTSSTIISTTHVTNTETSTTSTTTTSQSSTTTLTSTSTNSISSTHIPDPVSSTTASDTPSSAGPTNTSIPSPPISPKRGLSHTAKNAIILAVIGTVFVSGTLLFAYIRRTRRQQIAEFRKQLGRVPGLSWVINETSCTQGSEGSSSTNSMVGDRLLDMGTSTGRSISYPFVGGSSQHSSRIFF
ncbi:hypothetical protein BDP27DRAFT_500491 [Rhodocollybia butyracea]|uniref:Uncharacterized protein n=1 Tax=Rhodocollybia butyracea TaxID=206335 RepID=A0A9P5PYU4_9AGAR|nr:hypothetical protein BDP27DRAFT_500491 [Rhodocollybia butyracea]